MIGLTSRPPQLETPFSVFNNGPITPNDAFFVRYHLAGVPLNIDPDTFTLEIKGKVDRPLKLSLTEIRELPSIELVAVNQCSGNSRGFFDPRVAGGQLGNGAMGNARWRGVPLKTVLNKAGLQQGAKQVTFNGMDQPVTSKQSGTALQNIPSVQHQYLSPETYVTYNGGRNNCDDRLRWAWCRSSHPQCRFPRSSK
jgi:sulfite dehydrogenase (cytochrome) subunit A